MSLEAELKSSYAQVHARLLRPIPKPKLFPPQSKLSPQSTIKKQIIHIPIRTWGSPPQKSFPQESLPAPVLLSVILKLVSQIEMISIIELRSQRKPKRNVEARFIYYYLARKFTHCSWPKIGLFLGGRDHSTVVSGVERATALRDKDPNWRARLDDYEARLTGKPQSTLLTPFFGPEIVIEWIGA